MMDCNYTYDHYEEMLKFALDKGYAFYTTSDFFHVDLKEPFIVLVHDVDFDMVHLKNIMGIEKKLGIKSSYFFRLHGKYNIMFYNNYKIFKGIIENGNEIGLHYDNDFYLSFNEYDADKQLRKDCEVLSLIADIPVKCISYHDKSRQKKVIQKETVDKMGLYLCDHTLLDKDIRYITDSSHQWRDGCLCQWIKRNTPKIYVIIHPIWWFRGSSCENY